MYKYKKLLILVEGPGDSRFFDKVVKPKFEGEYRKVRIVQYSEMRKELVAELINKFEANDDHYICVGDIDKAPCASVKKQEMRDEKFENVDDDRMVVVIKKMEGWYLAGLSDDVCKRFGFSPLSDTDEMGRGQFRRLRHEKFSSDRDFMTETLKFFDIEIAKCKNKSFKYFAEKYGL